jgi:hypothetical protein
LDILLNGHILKINQDGMSLPVAPFPAPPTSGISESYLPTHWSGRIDSSQKVVLMVINPLDEPANITISWHDIPEFKNDTVGVYHFMEVSTLKITERWTQGGFVWTGIPPHGNIVMIVESYPHPTTFGIHEWPTLTYAE